MTIATTFYAGSHPDGAGVNILETRDGLIRATVLVPEGASEDYGYLTLKAAVDQMAAKHGLSVSHWYENQESYLEADASEGHATVEWLGEEEE